MNAPTLSEERVGVGPGRVEFILLKALIYQLRSKRPQAQNRVSLVGRDLAKLPQRPAKFTKCLDDNVDVCAGLFPLTPWEITYFDLAYAHAKLCRLGKNFSVDHRADASDLDVIEN